jgi:hypothetical protein
VDTETVKAYFMSPGLNPSGVVRMAHLDSKVIFFPSTGQVAQMQSQDI